MKRHVLFAVILLLAGTVAVAQSEGKKPGKRSSTTKSTTTAPATQAESAPASESAPPAPPAPPSPPAQPAGQQAESAGGSATPESAGSGNGDAPAPAPQNETTTTPSTTSNANSAPGHWMSAKRNLEAAKRHLQDAGADAALIANIDAALSRVNASIRNHADDKGRKKKYEDSHHGHDHDRGSGRKRNGND